MKKHALPVVVLALLATSAQASIIDWGTHDPIEMGEIVIPTQGVPTGFSDVFTFTVSAGTVLTATSAEALTGALLTPFDGTYALLSYGLDDTLGTSDDSIVGNWAFGADTGSLVHALSAGPGRYLYAVSGVAIGPDAGAYSITSIATGVPEPGAGLMLLTGLSVGGFLLRRRR